MSIKSMFNIGGLTLTIMCEDEIYSQGDQICGKVILRGGEYQQQALSVRLRLREFWVEGSGDKSRTVYNDHKTVILANATTFEPRSETAFDFSVQLPMNCRLPEHGSGWQIAVNVDIPDAVDPKADLTLSIRPSKEMIAFIDTIVEKLRFKADRFHWNRNDRTTRQRLLPPTALQSELDYIRFEMRNTESGLAIEAVFDLQEKSVEDYFKAIFNQDQTRRKFILTTEQIWTSDYQPNTEEISKVFVPLLQDVVAKHAQ